MKLIDQFIAKVIASSAYTEMDRTYLFNRVLALVGETGGNPETQSETLIELKEELVDLAVANGKVGALFEERDCLGAELMNLITPLPSKVNRDFWETYQSSPEEAIADFYALSQKNDYIKLAAIAKNVAFTTASSYGELEITINLSKPEKDPKAIAAAKSMVASSYPKCQLCMENEGYQGRVDHPARANHRIIRLPLGDETWGFQYSPYAYFNEHSIVLNTEHVPMVISQKTFEQLLAIVDLLPGYFVGSNADLPIVGGSILTHNHYQAGRHVFPMEKADIIKSFRFKGFEGIEAGIVNWPMSVLRLTADDKDELVDLAEVIRLAWCDYSDVDADIMAYTGDTPHHTVTPIARKKAGRYQLDLVLRDNHTSQEHPDGVYHPHADVQHIKKENIGLIEVMGLAILPPRLKKELLEVEKYLLNQYNEMADYHKDWAEQIRLAHPEISQNNVQDFVRQAVGQTFARVLEDAGVYKNQVDFMRFVESIGLAEA
ncbi:UDP-glucose--hexose-1-phosphate uridylyltransferase [Streptococcus hyovaginalis]|uniref:UDP-glucose--hexose-1-phosphate uridylyltransferase n=1 Tax=Streptococcus hyovaginalis TaxID=149015 RepID=UPI002A811508|nr:UDP-glucose--hexose-1-phosphate uridylyltransferase [Streptococcus hyovaginalis]MDY4511625.1 UDP-glucose--hexose-1-phosphate uridylyltransferase [Streptococcus hyovaginalis]